ncbi:MAG: sulfurtransferase [Cyanobacteria bacterium J06638_22]
MGLHSGVSFTASTPTVVSPAWLNENLHRSDIAIADCRFALEDPQLGQRQYQDGHIPGAIHFDLNADLSTPPQVHGGRHPLPSPDALGQTLAAAGISSQPSSSTGQPTWVIAYDDSRCAFAARFWWLLRYLGHTRVSVLDGGLRGWQEAGYSLTTEVPTPKPGVFVPQPHPEMVVDYGWVRSQQASPTSVLIDSRIAERYRGDYEPIDPIAGHILGALNYPWLDVTDGKGQVRSPKEQEERWSRVRSVDEVIVYCGSGVTACVNLLSMHLAGLPQGRLYAGSWSDWCSYIDSEH